MCMTSMCRRGRRDKKMLAMQLSGKDKEKRPKRRHTDAVREDMSVVGMTTEDADNKVRWRRIIHCGKQ